MRQSRYHNRHHISKLTQMLSHSPSTVSRATISFTGLAMELKKEKISSLYFICGYCLLVQLEADIAKVRNHQCVSILKTENNTKMPGFSLDE